MTHYIYTACTKCDELTVHTVEILEQTEDYFRLKETCLQCGKQLKIREPLDEINDVLDEMLEFYRYLDGFNVQTVE